MWRKLYNLWTVWLRKEVDIVAAKRDVACVCRKYHSAVPVHSVQSLRSSLFSFKYVRTSVGRDRSAAQTRELRLSGWRVGLSPCPVGPLYSRLVQLSYCNLNWLVWPVLMGNKAYLFMLWILIRPIPVATRSPEWVCDRLLAGITSSNLAGSLDVYRECCVLYR